MNHPGSTKTRPRTTPRLRTHTTTSQRVRRQHQRRPAETAASSTPAVAPMWLLDTTPITPAQQEQLWAMRLPERIQAMYDGQLSLAQLTHWSSHRPDQVPRIGGEFAYLAMREPAWCEPSKPAPETTA
jgi:hypothetical protein